MLQQLRNKVLHQLAQSDVLDDNGNEPLSQSVTRFLPVLSLTTLVLLLATTGLDALKALGFQFPAFLVLGLFLIVLSRLAGSRVTFRTFSAIIGMKTFFESYMVATNVTLLPVNFYLNHLCGMVLCCAIPCFVLSLADGITSICFSVSGTLILSLLSDSPVTVLREFSLPVWILVFTASVTLPYRHVARFRRTMHATQLEKQLSQATLTAAETNRVVSTLGHEFRTPLNGILGFSDMVLQSESLSEECREWVSTIRTSGRVLLSVANQVLDSARMDADKFQLFNAPFNVRSVLEDIVQVVSVSAKKSVDVVCRFAAEVPEMLEGDATRLQQILLNLLGNSVKFTSEGEIVVTVEVGSPLNGPSEESDEESLLDTPVLSLVIKVDDSGSGMTDLQREQLFQPFQVIDAEKTKQFHGAGLGLSIARRLAEKMGGSLECVRSAPGKGCTFVATVSMKSLGENPPPRWFLEECKIVVVSDNNVTGQLMSQALRAVGGESIAWVVPLNVKQLRDHSDWLQGELSRSMRAGLPHVMVLDIPRGLYTAGLLKQRFPKVSFVAYERASEHHTQKRVPGIRTLLKPIMTEQLQAAVQRLTYFQNTGRPITSGSDDDAGDITDKPLLKARRPSDMFSARVLVADDYHISQRSLALALRRLGCTVDTANDGEDAVDLAVHSGISYDLIFMDLSMPLMDGQLATKLIRKFETQRRSKRVPIVALVSKPTEHVRAECKLWGMNDVAAKPVMTVELEGALKKHVPERRLGVVVA